jgi:hypothetical protein
MPIGKRTGTDGTLYALIAFVFLFIVSMSAAIFCYLKYEEQKTAAEAAQRHLDEVASPSEVSRIGALVGTEQQRKSRLRAILDYLDETIALIAPGQPTDTSAEVKFNETATKVREAQAQIIKQTPELNDIEPNAALLQVAEKLSTSLQNTRTAEDAVREQLATLQNRFDDAMKASIEKEQALIAEKDKFQQQFETVRTGYDELKALLEKKTSDQVKDLYSKLTDERTGREETNKQLLKTQAELRTADERIQRILKEDVWPVRPPPDANVAEYEPDGKVILVDDQAKIVHINLGSDDHVYRGLTFSVYERNQPIPRDGKGKAEIEVYNVEKTISAARILRSNPKNPIVADDIAANLIWDPKKTNTFVIAGDFDLTGKGTIDPEGGEKLKNLVEKWGGKVADKVTVNTDFVVLGSQPETPTKPTLEETSTYPNAAEKYDKAVQRLADYKQILSQAQALSIPILNTERFLYFIGYKTQASNPGAF